MLFDERNPVMKVLNIGLLILSLFIFPFCKQQSNLSESISIPWITSIDSALVLAGQQDKILMIDFMATWCPPCQTMEDSTFNQTSVIDKTKDFLPVRIDVDQQGDIANQYNGNAAKYGGVGIPNILFLDKNKNRLKHLTGFQSVERLTAVMDSLLINSE